MKLNKILFFLSFLCLLAPVVAQEKTDDQGLEEEFIRSRAELGESHASGAREDLGPVILGNPTEAHTTIRVGLSLSTQNSSGVITNEFATRHFPVAEISHTVGTVHMIDVSTGKQIVALDVPGTIVSFTRDAGGYHVSIGGVEIGIFAGPIFLRPTDATNQFRVENIRRSFSGTFVPRYRGAIEISHGSGTPSGTVNVVNIIEIEDYVPGVVANESIASFHIEALKAQAIAARGYAIANIGRFRATFPYDIVDSSTSQVYRGVISEHPRAVQASQESTGLVASYHGQIISALYSSSMGGHTEFNEWIFNSPSSQLPGTNAVPYLRGIYDGDGNAPDFSTEAGVAAFWMRTTAPDTYDDCARTATTPTGTVGNTFSRWRFTLTQAQLRAKVPASIAGSITNVEVIQRMPSGRAAVVRLTLSSGQTFDVRGWDPLRTFFRPAVSTPRLCGTGTITANFTLNNPSVIIVNRNADTSLNNVTVWGGGWGHNVGMSQYGAHGRARAGQNFMQILKAYYTGVDIGSYPIDIGRIPGSGPPLLRQTFYAPNAAGTLAVRADGLKKLVVHVNDVYDIVLTEEQLSQPLVTVDISQYLVAGVNTIQYNPVGRNGGATVNVNVE
jgi:SpoIID/LytB domain protein